MTRKQMTMTQRRDALFAALETMRVQYDRAGYVLGCRASDPARFDTTDTRELGDRARSLGATAQGEAVRIFNSAVRAARNEAKAKP
jgi:hypothetical protein